MKRIISMLLVLLLMCTLVSCDIPDDIINFFMVQEVPEPSLDVLETFDLPENTIRTSMGDFGISYTLNGNELTVVGKADDAEAKVALLLFTEDAEHKQTTSISNGWFQIVVPLPEGFETLTAELYLGHSLFEEFESLLYDFVKLEKQDGVWAFADSPTLEENMLIFQQPKDLEDCLHETKDIPSTDSEIQTLSNEITIGCQSDYDKVLKIHDWVAENIYYDYDAFHSGDYGDPNALIVLHNKCGVCEGYANLFAALVRAQNIPCRVQAGFALGDGVKPVWTDENLNAPMSNHAWNEAYVDGRWMLIDTTWDSTNGIENGQWIKGNSINHIYFDAHMKFFSLSHRSMK